MKIFKLLCLFFTITGSSFLQGNTELSCCPLGFLELKNDECAFMATDAGQSDCTIRIAYMTSECTTVSKPLVETLNSSFDLVVVLDELHHLDYLSAGVHIPIYVYSREQASGECGLNGRALRDLCYWEGLRAKFLSALRPKSVFLGNANMVTDDYVTTSSKRLFKKFITFARGGAIIRGELDEVEPTTSNKRVSGQGLVDFETSMGKGDAYFGKHYDLLCENIESFSHFIPQPASTELVDLCRKTYEKYRLSAFPKVERKQIPRVIHQIWIGPKPFPEKYKEWQKTWLSLPGWSYKLWTDADVETFDFATKELFYREKNLGGRADLLRIEILNRYGGVYVDTDFELMDFQAFEKVVEELDFFAGLTPLDCGNLLVNNAIIGSVPNHPLLEACIKNIEEMYIENYVVANGPGFFSKMILSYADKGLRDVIFPATFFYPLGNQQMERPPYDLIPNTLAKLTRVKNDLKQPETFAIHWWESSWNVPDAWVE